MAEFVPAAKASFLDRFKRRYSAQEVDMYQKGAANDYGQTFRLVEREFEKALDSDTVPEGFNGDVDAWNQFRIEQKNKPATFFPDMTDVYKVLGKDTTNRFFAGTDLGSKLLDNPDDPETQKKNLNLDKTEEFVDPETGETRYAPAVDTYNVGEGGAVSGRTNEITDDGKPQSETQKFGFNNLSKDEFNAMVETARLAKLKEGGIYSEGFVQGDELFTALSTDGSLDAALLGDRNTVIDTVKKVELLKKGLTERGINITEGDSETADQSPIGVGSYKATDEQIRNLTSGFVGKYKKNLTVKKFIPANERIYKGLIRYRDNIAKLEKQIASPDPNKGGTVKNFNLENYRARKKKELLEQQRLYDNLIVEAQNSDVRVKLQTNLETLSGKDKTNYGSILAKPNFDVISKNPALLQELNNLGPTEFLQKYTLEDGTLDKEKLYGNQFSGDAAKVLDKNISDKKVDELFTAIEDGDSEKVKSILASVSISDEDQEKLLTEVQKTGGDYRKETDVNKKRKLYFATLGSLVPGSALFNALISPDNAISNMIETGMINDEGIKLLKDQQSLASGKITAAGDFDGYDTFNTIFSDYKNPENEEAFQNWDAARSSLGTAIRRMRANVAVAPTSIKISQLLNAEKELAREVIKNEGKPGFLMELVTLGFASDPDLDSFGNNINVGIVPPDATSADKITSIVASNGKQISLQQLVRDYGDELAASLISLAFASNKSKAGN
jgi:hypothetical protein